MANKRLRPAVADTKTLGDLPNGWSWFANGPIRGCGLMRERQWLYAWDDANTIYILDLKGELLAQRQAPKEIVGLAASETGESLIAVSRMGVAWWLDSSLRPRIELELPLTPFGVAMDPLGDYVVISGQQCDNLILNRGGKRVGGYKTTRPIKFLSFVPSEGTVVNVADQGLVACYSIDGEMIWSAAEWSPVGGIAVDGTGDAILLACFGHGIVRFNAEGKKEGTYRFDHAPALVAVDYEGTILLSASLERAFTQLTFEGTIKANRFLDEKPVALTLDALGRYAVLAFPDGELRYFRLAEFFAGGPVTDGGDSNTNLPVVSSKVPSAEPVWETAAANNLDEVDSAVLAAVPNSADVAVYTNRRNVRIFDGAGALVHETGDMPGLGRVLTVNERWLAAYNDSRFIAYDPKSRTSVPCALSLSEISHVELFDDFGDVLVVEACEYVRRIRLPEEVVWKRRLEYKVGTSAVQRAGKRDASFKNWSALTLDDHNLMILDESGKPSGKYRARPSEPLTVVAVDEGWVTSARDSGVIRGHEPDGTLAWTTPLPWPPWSIRRVGAFVLVTSVEGYSVLVDENGELLKESSEGREGASYFARGNNKVARLFRTGQTIIATTFGGKLIWRHAEEHRLGPMQAGRDGVWVFVGRQLKFFRFE
ncbi:MAG: hypothetical protein U1D30_08515 [Planctomycetota bacterium]